MPREPFPSLWQGDDKPNLRQTLCRKSRVLSWLLFYWPQPRQRTGNRKCLLGLQFQRARVHDCYGGGSMVTDRQAWHCYRSRELTSHPQALGRERELTGNGIGFWNLKAHPQRHTSSSKTTPPNSSQIVPWNKWALSTDTVSLRVQ